MSKPFVVAAMYRFVRLPDFQSLRAPLLERMQSLQIKGTLLLAHEGINGTVCGSREHIDALLHWLRSDARFERLDVKESYSDEMPFYRSKVKLKKEIVTLGVPEIDPNRVVGTYVQPRDWNALISDPEVTVIDTRNDYECRIGSFRNAVNPGTDSFREFPQYVADHLDPQKHTKVAMFCTGGIRCEKSTAYLKQLGFTDVYHLQGGILKYLEEVDPADSLWEGECFVFDNRVAVNHALEKGQYDQCHACRSPITEDDKAAATYRPGVSCPHCHEHSSTAQKNRFAERERQMRLARARGETHIGGEARQWMEKHRQAKHKKRASGD